MLFRSGGTGGFCAFMGYDRVQRTGIVALANAFALRSVDELGMQFLSPKFQPSAPPAPTPEPGLQLDPAILDRYIGRYQLAADRVFEIMRDGDRLFAQASAQSVPGPKFELAAETETQFRVNITKSQISFETGPDGQATHMVMQRAGGQPTRAPRLP